MGYATDELDPKDYVDAHLFYDLVFAAVILVALMEIIKSHKYKCCKNKVIEQVRIDILLWVKLVCCISHKRCV